jgi:hypothetical protein
MAAHKTERDWIELVRELIAALYDVLSLQSNAFHTDSLFLLRRIIINIIIAMIIVFLFLLFALFASLALATFIAHHYNWIIALSVVSFAHLLLAIFTIFIRSILLKNGEPIFPQSKYILNTLKNNLSFRKSGSDKDANSI